MLDILLVDDHKLFLEGIKGILIQNPKVNSVTMLTEPKKVLPFLISHKTDVLFTDLNMPDFDGIDLIQKVRNEHPKVKICVLTMYYNFNLLASLKKHHVDAYLHKSMEVSEFDDALEAISRNEKYYSYESAKVNQAYDLIVNKEKEGENIKDDFIRKHMLSPREFEVLKLIVENYSTKEIAEKLFLSELTISTYRKYIIKKTGCKTAVELYKYALDSGIMKHN
jgi:two-component system, NarL family, nitrate/nitrite response regulator NarL